MMWSIRVKIGICYSVLTFELLHNLHSEIHRYLEVLTVKRVLYDKLRSGGMQKENRAFLKSAYKYIQDEIYYWGFLDEA